MDYEQLAQESAMYPWLDSGSMSDPDLLDAMADRAYELEEAMREADESEFTLIDPMEDMHDDESN